MKKIKAKIHIGTSGWVYDDWGDDVFYPSDISNREWLEFYSRQFGTVEINATFYHQMSTRTFVNWHSKTPREFVFSVKMSRFLTHVKKLNDPQEPWQRFINHARYLQEKLGPILVQLPPNLHVNLDKLKNLVRVIPKRYKIALEARHQSWFCPEVYDVLKKHSWAMVFSYGEGLPMEEVITADFVYVRMHGSVGLYDSKYTTKQLQMLAGNIKKWQRKVQDIYIYFNNDTKGYAVENVKKLEELVGDDQ